MATKRGPSYPALGLGAAIHRAKQLYDQDGKAQTTQDVAIQAWGYTSKNGASLRTLSAVRQYGLLDGGGDRVRVSDRALAIILEPQGSAERVRAIREAAESPAIFAALMKEYPDEVPSDATMIAHLVRRLGFDGVAANRIVEAFRETVDLVKQSSGDDITSSAQKSAPDDQIAPVRVPTHYRPVTGEQVPTVQPEAGRMEFTWPLSGNALATLTVTRTLDPEDIETLEDYFKIAKKALAKAAKSHQTAVAAASVARPDVANA